MQQPSSRQISYKELFAFFIPLGISASLTAITHLIINSTLSRGEDAAFIVACYAVAFSVFSILERPLIIFRQTSSVLAQGKKSFQSLNRVFLSILVSVTIISIFLSFSPLGEWVFVHFFNATPNMVRTITAAFNVFIIVYVFSGVRGMYQGVIINHLETKWLTLGVVVRLSIMFITSFTIVTLGVVSSMAGAMIFLVGMFIECVVSVWKGHRLLKYERRHKDKDSHLSKTSILKFYVPLFFYFTIETLLIPIVYVFIAKAEQVELSIASFALALSISQLLLSFFMYTHQLVIQFYKHDRKRMISFMIVISTIPSLMLAIMCFSPTGNWFMSTIMGADDALGHATLTVLGFFIFKTLLFPWVDFLNGFLMLHRQTNKMVYSQVTNLVIVVLSLFLLTTFAPQLNGINGLIAVSLGEVGALVTVSLILSKLKLGRQEKQKASA